MDPVSRTHVYITILKSVKNIQVLSNSDNLNERIKIFQDLFNLYDELKDEFSEEKRFLYGCVLECIFIDDSIIEKLCKINKDW